MSDVRQLRSVHWGTGAIGDLCLREAQRHPLFAVRGVVSNRGRARATSVVADIFGEQADHVAVGGTLADVMASVSEADVLFLATYRRMVDLEGPIAAACGAGMNVVCSGEESIYPTGRDSDRAHLDAIAHSTGTRVVGIGVNPGFVMDVLPLVLTGVTRDWTAIKVRRRSDLTGYGASVLESIGIGLSVPEFQARLGAGDVDGHVGFENSVALLANELGLPLRIVERTQRPMIREDETVAGSHRIGPRRVIGVVDTCRAVSPLGHEVVMEHPQSLGAVDGEEQLSDRIDIAADPPVHFAMNPGVDGAAATVALMLNAALCLAEVPPGFYPASRLPLGGHGRTTMGQHATVTAQK